MLREVEAGAGAAREPDRGGLPVALPGLGVVVVGLDAGGAFEPVGAAVGGYDREG